MYKIIILFLLSLTLFTAPSLAKDSKPTPAKTNNQKISIKVEGMVCAFCAQGVEKSFKKKEEVLSTKVDLDKMNVEVEFKKGKSLDQKVLEKMITDAGFKFVGINK